MKLSYNHIAGQNVERLAALSDGIFGVGMTLLVLDLAVPAVAALGGRHSERALWLALAPMGPRLLMYLMSFLTLGIFWVGQQSQLNHLARTDHHLTWINLGFLFAVTLTPFLTKLLAEYPSYRTALLAYWGNILLLGLFLYLAWGYAVRFQLLRPDSPVGLAATVCRRIVIAQSLYAAGALLCVFSTYLSIAAIVLVQLNYVFAFGSKRPIAARGEA